MKTILSLIAILLATIAFSVSASPIKINLEKIKSNVLEPTTVDYLRAMEKKVNDEYIPAMLDVLKKPQDDKTKTILFEAFGNGWEQKIPAIQEKVQKIQGDTLTVSGDYEKHKKHDLVLQWQPLLRKVVRGDKFRHTGLLNRNRPLDDVMIPALLALADAVEKFTSTFDPMREGLGSQALHGEKDFKQLHAKGATACVYNVYSYTLFAKLALEAHDTRAHSPAAHPHVESSKKRKNTTPPAPGPSEKRQNFDMKISSLLGR